MRRVFSRLWQQRTSLTPARRGHVLHLLAFGGKQGRPLVGHGVEHPRRIAGAFPAKYYNEVVERRTTRMRSCRRCSRCNGELKPPAIGKHSQGIKYTRRKKDGLKIQGCCQVQNPSIREKFTVGICSAMNKYAFCAVNTSEKDTHSAVSGGWGFLTRVQDSFNLRVGQV